MERNLLLEAIKKNRLDIVTLLINKGADVNQKYGSGITPLIMAIREGNSKIVKFLLEKGANSKIVFANPSTKITNITPLMVAAAGGSVDIMKMLFAAGVDPLLKDSEGKTALDYAQKQISSYTSDEDKKHLKEIINFLLISYIQHFMEALNMLRRVLIK